MFAPKFPVTEIDRLLRAYWPVQSKRMQDIELDLESRAQRIRSARYLTKEDFTLVCSWTAFRAKPHYEKNSEDQVQRITARAFSVASERERISILDDLSGVGYPVASTILHFFHRDTYPILTHPSLWSLGAADEPYSFDFWWRYTQYFRSLVADWRVSARNLDRALWQYSYENEAR